MVRKNQKFLLLLLLREDFQKNLVHFSICACHPCAGAMLIFSVSFQFYRMIPEGALVEVLGCTIKWTKTALKIWHPKHGHLKVGLRNRCPEIAALDALQRIKELEEKQLEEFNSQLHEMELRLEALQCDESKSWTKYLLTFRKDGSHFADVLLPRICLLTCLR